ncbi:MAG: sugar O-acetyltransferase [Selenomonadaceae bacterium]|nr:sugar O-acetyltransferase [Selenomonadaceae bacterium]
MIEMSAKGDMLAGKWYNANFDSELLRERMIVKDYCLEFNNTPMKDLGARRDLLREILQNVEVEQVEILTPFIVDYGYNVFMGAGCFFNHNVYLMDCAKITFGKKCFVGPNCGFYTALHPLDVAKRNAGFEQAKPITIGDNVWLGGNVVVLPGVTIGSNSVIGAGSVVTKNIPAGVVAFGNPCKVVKEVPNLGKGERK